LRPQESVVTQPPDEKTIGAFVNRLRESGESAFNKLSEQLLENPMFMAAFRRAVEAKGQVDKTVSGTLDLMNLPSKNDVQRLEDELRAIATQLARQQRAIAGLERTLVQLNATVAEIAARSSRPSDGGS
jgi:hypothetical protein